MTDRVAELEAEVARLRAENAALRPSDLRPGLHPQDSYISISRTATARLRALVGEGLPEEWWELRRMVIGACAGASVVPGSLRVKYEFAADLTFAGVPVVLLCDVGAGSPKGEREQTVTVKDVLEPGAYRMPDGRRRDVA